MTRRRIAPAAVFAALVAATPVLSEAHDYGRYDAYQRYQDECTDRIHDHGVTGALLGGAAGAVIGSNVAGHGAHAGGALLGAAAGAALGSNIARSTTKDRCRGPGPVAYRYAPAPVYVAPPPPPPMYVMAPPPPPPTYVYESVSYRRHDHGRHLGWYKHHGDDDD
jgi:hypothetical protein